MFVILVPAVVVLWGFPGETGGRVVVDDQARPDADLPRRRLRRRRVLLPAHVPRRALAAVVGGHLRRGVLRDADADRDADPLGSLQPRRRADARGDRVLRLGDRLHRLAVRVGALWWLNRRTDSGEPLPGEPLVPPRVLLAARLFGIGAFGAAIVFFVVPGDRDRPLAVAADSAHLARARLVHGAGRRRRAAALHRPALGLVEAAACRRSSSRSGCCWWAPSAPGTTSIPGNVLTYLYVGGLAAQTLALALLYRRMARRRPCASGGAPRPPSAAARARPGA